MVYPRSLGSGLLLESEFLLSAAEDELARQNKDALAFEWNEGFESRQGEIDLLQERTQSLEVENRSLRRMLMQKSPSPTGTLTPPVAQQAKDRLLQERMGALLGL